MAAYQPTPFKGEYTPENIEMYLQRELEAISRSLMEMEEVELRPVFAAPPKPREGMIVFADGTKWNPGGGKGVYVYSAGAWSKL